MQTRNVYSYTNQIDETDVPDDQAAPPISGKGDSSLIAVIIGAVIGGAAMVACTVLAVVCWNYKRRSSTVVASRDLENFNWHDIRPSSTASGHSFVPRNRIGDVSSFFENKYGSGTRNVLPFPLTSTLSSAEHFEYAKPRKKKKLKRHSLGHDTDQSDSSSIEELPSIFPSQHQGSDSPDNLLSSSKRRLFEPTKRTNDDEENSGDHLPELPSFTYQASTPPKRKGKKRAGTSSSSTDSSDSSASTEGESSHEVPSGIPQNFPDPKKGRNLLRPRQDSGTSPESGSVDDVATNPVSNPLERLSSSTSLKSSSGRNLLRPRQDSGTSPEPGSVDDVGTNSVPNPLERPSSRASLKSSGKSGRNLLRLRQDSGTSPEPGSVDDVATNPVPNMLERPSSRASLKSSGKSGRNLLRPRQDSGTSPEPGSVDDVATNPVPNMLERPSSRASLKSSGKTLLRSRQDSGTSPEPGSVDDVATNPVPNPLERPSSRASLKSSGKTLLRSRQDSGTSPEPGSVDDVATNSAPNPLASLTFSGHVQGVNVMTQADVSPQTLLSQSSVQHQDSNIVSGGTWASSLNNPNLHLSQHLSASTRSDKKVSFASTASGDFSAFPPALPSNSEEAADDLAESTSDPSFIGDIMCRILHPLHHLLCQDQQLRCRGIVRLKIYKVIYTFLIFRCVLALLMYQEHSPQKFLKKLLRKLLLTFL